MDSILPSSLSASLNAFRSSQPPQDKQASFKLNTIDDYLSKIGFGIYQIRAYLILGFVLINDGAEVIVLSFLFSILSKEWGLTNGQIGFLGSTVFAGFFLGALVSGKISDTYGRKNALVYIVLLLYIFGMWSAFVYSFAMLVFVRTVFGFLVGIQFPMCITYLTEITPKEVRGKWLVLAGGFFTLGEFLACFIAFLTLDSASSGNWRALFIWVAQPAFLCALGIKYLMHESPRYEIAVKKNYYGGVKILENIARANGVGLELNEEDGDKIKNHLESKTTTQNEEQTASFSMLLKDKFKMISLLLWPIWGVLSLVYYGMVYILPMALAALGTSSSSGDIWSVVLAVCSEIPSIIFGYFMIENSKFGRKNSLVYGFAGCSIACLFAGVLGSFVLWVSVARGIINFAFTVIYPYTAELYPTTIRTTGLGTASAASKVGGMLMPWITLSLFGIGPKVPFIGFCIFCALGAFCCYKLPYDTTNKELDALELELGELPKAKN